MPVELADRLSNKTLIFKAEQIVALLWKSCAAHFQVNEMASSNFGLL